MTIQDIFGIELGLTNDGCAHPPSLPLDGEFSRMVVVARANHFPWIVDKDR
jgi:hypothetical protein